MAEQAPPTFVYQEIFEDFQQFAKLVMAAKAEPYAMVLVVPWRFDAKYPPGAIVTRGGSQLTTQDLLVCAKQLRAMADRMYEMFAATAEQAARRAEDAEQRGMEGRTAVAKEGQTQRAKDE